MEKEGLEEDGRIGGQGEKEILGGVNNTKDIKKSHMESYHCRSFLTCVHMYKNNYNGIVL